MRLDPTLIQREIANLLIAYPELKEDDALRADVLEGQTNAFEFIREMVRRIGKNDAMIEGLKVYIQELSERKKRFENREHAFRSLIFKIMQAADLPHYEMPEATVSIRPGQHKVIVTDESILPDHFVRVKREPDKINIRESLLAGVVIPGAELSNAESVLQIRTK